MKYQGLCLIYVMKIQEWKELCETEHLVMFYVNHQHTFIIRKAYKISCKSKH